MSDSTAGAVDPVAAQSGSARGFDRVQDWGALGVWDLDLVTMRSYWSTQIFHILGLDAVSSRAFLDRVHAEDRDLVVQVAVRACEQPGPYRVEHRFHRRGELRSLGHHIQSVAGPDGRPNRLIGVIRDTTDQRAIRAEVEAAAAIRSAGLLASSLVHSFKNQLVVVLGHTQLAIDALERGELPMREGLEAIQRAATNGVELTRRVLAVGRAPSSASQPVGGRSVLERVAELARPLVGEANRVTITADPRSAPVLVPAARLEQVLLDFVINAADALPRSGGTLRLSYREVRLEADGGSHLAPGRYGAFVVADDGAGMDDETRRRATEPFFTTKGETAGSGIGLSAAASFADELGGRLAIRSTVDDGTEVELLVPLATPPSPARRPGAPLRVVLLTVDPAAGSAAEAGLVEHGVQVVMASSWDDADRYLRTEPIDGVVVGHDLPVEPPSVPAEVVIRCDPSDASEVASAIEALVGHHAPGVTPGSEPASPAPTTGRSRRRAAGRGTGSPGP